MAPLELWGGVECTVNRVGEVYRDQIRSSGHDDRPDDLHLIAELGVRALRFPVLWERVAADRTAGWSWCDTRLAIVRERNIRPIAGLVHHGSGPRHTNLLDDGFAAGLAGHAGEAAARYDWIADWTPINEPVTTARFSALYGHWYPHHRDERSFWLSLLNQVDAVRLSMAAIRRVRSDARLIQTDDLGRTYATTPLARQAAFDNMRRWAGWDLLFGRLTREHMLWPRIAAYGFGDRLRAIADAPSAPDVVGINHYLTSDRFLDHRLQRYPPHLHGGNGRMRYADTEAVRVVAPTPDGLAGALKEAWARYRTPIALTEVHNGSTREEQLRWAAEAWDTATAIRDAGADIRAVTAWSLLGSHGWNTLLTRGCAYESGVFDVAAGRARPTALAALWRGLPTGTPRHPVARESGWWRRESRLTHPPMRRPSVRPATDRPAAIPPVLICGATGTLGQAFARACRARNIRHIVTSRAMLDLERDDAIAGALDRWRPWAVVNAAGWVQVDEAEANEAGCHRANAGGAAALACACDAREIQCLGFSSDLVFDGTAGRPYLESDVPAPLGAYGRSKAALERNCAAFRGSLIIRTAAFFSPHDPHNFAAAVIRALADDRPFAAAEDHVVTPTYVPDLVDTALDLLIDRESGLWHLTNGEPVSWAGFAARVATACGYGHETLRPVAGASLGWIAPRPLHVALGSERGAPLAPLDNAIARFAANHHRHPALIAA